MRYVLTDKTMQTTFVATLIAIGPSRVQPSLSLLYLLVRAADDSDSDSVSSMERDWT